MRFEKTVSTVVLVTDQMACERIIKAASVVSRLNNSQLLVLSVQRSGSKANPEALEHLFSVAKEYEAHMVLEFADDVRSAIFNFIADNRAISAVTGIPEGKHSVLVQLWQMLPSVEFYTVSMEGQLQEVFSREHHREMVRLEASVGDEIRV